MAFRHFDFPGEISSIRRYGEGHIHETYLVKTKGHHPDYILQKINRNIFHDIPGIMENIEAVTNHLRKKLLVKPGHDPDRETLTLVRAKSGELWFEDEQGDPWRMYLFIPGTVTYQKMPGPSIAYESGLVTGRFLELLADLKTPLKTTIPAFHDIGFRISQYLEAKKNDPAKRTGVAAEAMSFAEKRFEQMKDYFAALKAGSVLRPTHNDTKLNNILFDENGRGLCLVDLDTVMPGYAHFDYGDALRTMANTSIEDEKDLASVQFDQAVYESFTEGFLQATEGILTPDEIKLLPFAPIYMTFIIGLRFLTDFLNGDKYFRAHYDHHNLVRAMVQFRLVNEMEGFKGDKVIQ
ncbi:MAG: aminoglycoside phosphotransferase family protein [Bacteroidales bacterium]